MFPIRNQWPILPIDEFLFAQQVFFAQRPSNVAPQTIASSIARRTLTCVLASVLWAFFDSSTKHLRTVPRDLRLPTMAAAPRCRTSDGLRRPSSSRHKSHASDGGWTRMATPQRRRLASGGDLVVQGTVVSPAIVRRATPHRRDGPERTTAIAAALRCVFRASGAMIRRNMIRT